LSDSTGAISIARDPVKHELTKHIGVDAFYTYYSIVPFACACVYIQVIGKWNDGSTLEHLQKPYYMFSPNQ
jgi:hypothetical protein